MEQHMYSDVSKPLVHKRRKFTAEIPYPRFSTTDVYSPEQSALWDGKAYQRAIERWENEGGATLV